ncbi:hypothetical protein ACSAZL_10400 [Methanosarcina sp. T3]|uniref:hypothetical protein n=1 Tax=Methanosarcina sp. T3 TaxID=3439062 RepID=UPI003F848965
MERPIGVTILALLAILLAILNGIATLRFLGFFPFIGPLDIRIFNLWYALLYGLLTYIWAWVAKMLWEVNPQGWMFMAVIAVFSLCVDFVVLITGGSWYDVSLSVIVSALILIYVMLPGVREAFGTD